ncbi:DUF4159 domain-containing protein [Verrucomicrobiota bacterium]
MKAIKYISLILVCFTIWTITGTHESALGDERWNATPNDINNLLKSLKKLEGINGTTEIKTIAEVDANPEKNPIIYYSGHYNYEFAEGDRKMLREYMLAGGMMVFNTGLGSEPFYRSTKKELNLIFPEIPLQRISSDHPIFHAYYDVDLVKYSPGVYKTGFVGNEPWMDGVTVNCRLVALVSRFGMAVAWDGGEVHPQFASYMPDSAVRLGLNILSYATASRAWAKQEARKIKIEGAEDPGPDAMRMVQVVYDGEWKTRHAGMSVLLQTFNKKTEVPVNFGVKETKLSDKEIYDAPLLYIIGHEHFRLKKTEKAMLKKYLENGGFLFAEACCGRKGFDLAIRELMKSILPQPMKPIPANDSIFSMPNEITKLGVTSATAKELGEASISPKLEGIKINGYYAVIYSPLGMAGAWEMSQNPYAHGYNTDSALKLGQNILMYSILQ